MSLADSHPDHQFPRLSRRSVLKAGAAISVGAALAPAWARSAHAAQANGAVAPKAAAGRAKNVIFMVSDGMSTGTLTLADMDLRSRGGAGSQWVNLWASPGTRRAAARTHAADSLVTDSAAGGSAWGSGRHINNGCLNVLPDGTQLLPIMVHARQAGKATGVVTTARVTHATPASFYANVPKRDLEGMIGVQLLERRIDVALGGGAKFLPDSETAKHPDVQIVRNKDQLRGAAPGGRLLGLFDDSHVPFVRDRTETVPNLADMTRAALRHLENKPEGFVLQIEGGRVDHAAHNNDAGALLYEQLEFDATLGAVVIPWVAQHFDDTLLVITTDHGNANPGLTLYGEAGKRGFERLRGAKKSFDWIHDQVHGIKPVPARVEKMAEAVKTASGYDLTAEDKRLLTEVLSERRTMAFAEANKWTSVLGAILADYYGVAFLSPNHTADYVEVTALGPGSEPIRGLIDNTDLHPLMVAAMGLPQGKLLPGMDEPMPLPKPPKPD